MTARRLVARFMSRGTHGTRHRKAPCQAYFDATMARCRRVMYKGVVYHLSQAYVEPDGHDNQCHSHRGEHP